MGYRGKFMTECVGCITLPTEFVEKYKDDYYLGEYDGKYLMNISSKSEEKSHAEIISDLQDLLVNAPFNAWAVTLFEDGIIDRHNLSKGNSEKIGVMNHEC